MLQYLIGAFVGLGVFLVLSDYFRVPFFATSKAVNTLAHRQEIKTSSLDLWLKDLAVWVSKRLRLNEYKRMQLQADLRSAGIPLSPEMHIANALVKAVLIGLVAIPVYFLMPILSPVILILAVLIYLKSSKGVADKIKEKRKKIEYELPRFVAHIDKTLKHNRDVLYIIDSYKANAGKEIGRIGGILEMMKFLRNKRGTVPIPTAVLVLVFALVISVAMYIAYVQVQTMTLRNAMKT